MERRRSWPIAVLLTVLVVRSTHAGTLAPALQVDAKAAVLLDADSGQVLFDQNATARIAPASLTKLMTVYLAYDALREGTVRLDEQVSVTQQASKMGGSQVFLRTGDQVSFEKLLQGVAIVSGNDATIALAEHLAGFPAAFVARMNAKASELRLGDTRFQNAHGLSAENQYSTARDMARLALSLIQDHPAALQLHSMKHFEYKGIRQQNRNLLLGKDPRVDGLKTGWLEEAGYHIVLTGKEAERRLIVAVLGARNERSRHEIALRLLNYGFKNFHNVVFFRRGDRVKNLPVWKGAEDLLAISANRPGIVTVMNGSPEPTLAYQLSEKLIAPISDGQKVGEVVITAEGQEVARLDLVAMNAVPRGGLMKRIVHSVLLLFN
jgi:D-alanyl-D-alanine carboxypeptidase (penicillin-binding protein 5/6)